MAKRLRGHALRMKLLQRDGNACFVCGKAMNFNYGHKVAPYDATIEHVIEQREGGGWNRDNLALSHRHCNVQRSRYSLIVKRWDECIAIPKSKWVMPAYPAMEDVA